MNLFQKKSSLESSRHTIRFIENLLRASSDGIVITDTTQNIIVINEAFCELFSQNRKDMLETNLLIWLDQFDSNSLKKWNGLDSEVLRPGLPDGKFRSGDYRYFLLPSRLHRWKRIDLAIKAFKYVKVM